MSTRTSILTVEAQPVLRDLLGRSLRVLYRIDAYERERGATT